MKLWKKGLLMTGLGIFAVVVAYLPGAGPCGPGTPIGLVIMLLGLFSIPVGAILFLIGLVKASP